ncbi:MAG: hypothetical protein M1815_002988 [Lichina confinis]|nr:MAG: hypothetical protein M1815_002988 [Lichina confinis]
MQSPSFERASRTPTSLISATGAREDKEEKNPPHSQSWWTRDNTRDVDLVVLVNGRPCPDESRVLVAEAPDPSADEAACKWSGRKQHPATTASDTAPRSLMVGSRRLTVGWRYPPDRVAHPKFTACSAAAEVGTIGPVDDSHQALQGGPNQLADPIVGGHQTPTLAAEPYKARQCTTKWRLVETMTVRPRAVRVRPCLVPGFPTPRLGGHGRRKTATDTLPWLPDCLAALAARCAQIPREDPSVPRPSNHGKPGLF